MNGAPAGQSLWQEARNSDGRVYYYNVQTKATQWEKPVELMTPVEVRAPFSGVFWRSSNMPCPYEARLDESTMEGVHSREWPKVLVQHRDKAKHLGHARGLQECACAGINSAAHGAVRRVSFVPENLVQGTI